MDEGKKVAAYVLYLNPLGGYRAALDRFYKQSRGICVNKAHDYFTHATLTSFQLPDSSVLPIVIEILARTHKQVVAENEGGGEEGKTKVNSYWGSKGSMGLNVTSPSATQLVAQYKAAMEEASLSTMRLASSPLHISLAYGKGVKDHITALKDLVSNLRISDPSFYSTCEEWEVALYARTAGDPPELWMAKPLWTGQIQ